MLMFASGIPLFLSEAIKGYYSFAFWVKMTSLFLGILFTFTVRRRVTRMDLTSTRPLLGRFTALLSLGLWFGVGWADAGSGFRRGQGNAPTKEMWLRGGSFPVRKQESEQDMALAM